MIRRKKIAAFFFGLFLFLSAPGAAEAATYYVATNGSDSAAGTESAPFKTIRYAVKKMVAGDTTYVRGGVYNDEAGIHFGRSGTQSAPIKLLNYPGESPIIDFGGAVGVYHADGYHPERAKGTDKRILISNFEELVIQTSWKGAVSVPAPIGWITVEGFELRNGYNGFKVHNIHDVVIRRNSIHHNVSQGINGNGINVLVDRNIIARHGNFAACEAGGTTNLGTSMCNQIHGIYVTGTQWVITNNLIYDNLAMGIVVAAYKHCPQGGCWGGSPGADPKIYAGYEYGDAKNWVIANNTFAYNAYRPAITLWMAGASNSRIINNIFYENSPNYGGGDRVQGVIIGGNKGHVIEDNICYSTKGLHCISPDSQGKYTGSNNITANPNFENAGATLSGVPNFKLKAGSPAIDKGQNLLPLVTWDHQGIKRPAGAAFEIGAYEFCPPSTVCEQGSPPPNPTGDGVPPAVPRPPSTYDPTKSLCPI